MLCFETGRQRSPYAKSYHMVRRYVGVEDATGTELFYYFVESERSPGTDALLLWLSGGPRCSVLSGLALEIGSSIIP